MLQDKDLKNKKLNNKKLFGEGLKFEKVYYDISKLIGTLELPDYIDIQNAERGTKFCVSKNY